MYNVANDIKFLNVSSANPNAFFNFKHSVQAQVPSPNWQANREFRKPAPGVISSRDALKLEGSRIEAIANNNKNKIEVSFQTRHTNISHR